MKKFFSEYRRKKSHIKKRLKDFERIGKGRQVDIFAELCFCILTPQTKATACNCAVNELKNSGLLLRGSRREISRRLKGLVRFHNNKAAYIVSARRHLGDKKNIRARLYGAENILAVRRWLVDNIKGLGYKEASHFLRNIGRGKDIAIIDRHVLTNLKKYGVIQKVPTSISRKRYHQIEEKMRSFARRVGIPLAELDLLFWSNQTGFVFK